MNMHTEHNNGSEASDFAIDVQNVGVRYRIPKEGVKSLKELFVRSMTKRLVFEDFWALQNVTFQIPSGSIFGVVGRNGAGKSTLLKVIARVLYPTGGRIIIRGKVAPLLELGGGFHNDLTGRENVYLNASLLGYKRKEIDELIPSIIDFSEIGDFIDAPLRTYSSGMVARLGFSIATAKQPEILLVDEVLSVGDSAFQQKCSEKMMRFHKNGSTIVIVSHSMQTIQALCNQAVWIEDGKVKMVGTTESVANAYTQSSHNEPISIASREKVSTPAENPEASFEFEDVPSDYWAHNSIRSLKRTNLLAGYPDRTFRPEQTLTRVQFTAFILSIYRRNNPLTMPVEIEQVYSDIPIHYWYAGGIYAAHQLGFTLAGNRFWPDQGITRAEAMFLLLKSIYGPEYVPPDSRGVFADVPSSHWAASWIEAAYGADFLPEWICEDGRFSPESPITRAEGADIIFKALKLPQGT
jgi:ABC-type polysaccharide/polyol phosphate transport system ATPase subunit